MKIKKARLSVKCKRCGKCCVYKDERGNWRECRFITRDSKGFTTCIRYHKRLGTHIGNSYYCRRRVDIGYNIPDCPYNVKGQMPHPAYEDKNK